MTPCKTESINDDFVVLKADGLDKDTFAQHLRWEGGEAVAGEPLKRRVSRAAASRTPIQLVRKMDEGVHDELIVWVVWADEPVAAPQVTFLAGIDENDLNDPTDDLCTPAWQRIAFTATIQPQAIFDLQQDVPA